MILTGFCRCFRLLDRSFGGPNLDGDVFGDGDASREGVFSSVGIFGGRNYLGGASDDADIEVIAILVDDG